MKLLRGLLLIPGLKTLFQSYCTIKSPLLERTICGINFKNPVGLAAGFDKNGDYLNELFILGFGFIEVGTVTPRAQSGNEKPRLFRLIKDEALINRMGFNNHGADYLKQNLLNYTINEDTIIGVNIGKNKITSNDQATKDYDFCFLTLAMHSHYIVVNVSSPNTPGLRELQDKEPLRQILQSIQHLKKQNPQTNKPVFLKIAPDLINEQLDDIISLADEHYCDGVIATNTSLDRSNLLADREMLDAIGAGGLSGKPVLNRSNEVIRYLRNNSKSKFPIIGVGGIHTVKDAISKLDAGADLIQVYTGFIYEGPFMIRNINKALIKYYSDMQVVS